MILIDFNSAQYDRSIPSASIRYAKQVISQTPYQIKFAYE